MRRRPAAARPRKAATDGAATELRTRGEADHEVHHVVVGGLAVELRRVAEGQLEAVFEPVSPTMAPKLVNPLSSPA